MAERYVQDGYDEHGEFVCEHARLYCARRTPWDMEATQARRHEDARRALALAATVDLRRIGSVRADQLVSSAMYLAVAEYLKTYSSDVDEALNGAAFAAGFGDRAHNSAEAQAFLPVLTGDRRGDIIEAACVVAVNIAMIELAR